MENQVKSSGLKIFIFSGIVLLLITIIVISVSIKEEEKVLTPSQRLDQKQNVISTIEVIIDVSPKVESGKLYVHGKTNLPNQTNLMMNLSKGNNYSAQDKIIVQNGTFKSTGFSNKGLSLPNGDYVIEISTPLSRLQPESVQIIVGEKGKNLTGSLVVRGVDIFKDDNFVSFKTNFKIDDPVNASEKISYSIIKDKSYQNIKRSVDVWLDNRITKNQLATLAHEIRNLKNESYKRTFILYYLPGMSIDSVAWASTHFNPDLDVKILGTTIEQTNKLTKPIKVSSDKTVIGNYLQEMGSLSRRITIYRENGKVFIMNIFLDGSQGIEEYRESKVSNGLRLDELKKNSFGEYYLVNKNGDLESWDSEGLIETLKEIK